MNRRELSMAAAITVVLVLIAGGVGVLIGSHLAASPTTRPLKPKPLYWVSPMAPSYRRNKPGKDPMGMRLVPVYASQKAGKVSSDVRISPWVIDNIGVRVAPVRVGTMSRRIRTVGYVSYDDNRLTTIASRVGGWIRALQVNSVGDRVAKGDLLYELFSPQLVAAQSEYLADQRSGLPRLIAAARQRLRALGVSRRQIVEIDHHHRVNRNVARYAPSNGVVVSLGVRKGAYVTPETQVMQLADLSALWVLGEVDERDAERVHVGQKVIARFSALPGQLRTGRVDYVYPLMSAETRTFKVRIRLTNTDGQLKPNMYAHIAILAAPRPHIVFIPSSALIRTGDSERVAVALGGGRFDICPVVAGFSSNSRTQILKGLMPGEKVVVSAQFLIDSEANVRAAALSFGTSRKRCLEAETDTPGVSPAPEMAPRGGDLPNVAAPSSHLQAHDRQSRMPSSQERAR